MRSKIIVMVTVMSLVWSVGAIAAALAQGQSADAELQKFQGTWVMVSAEMDGKKVSDADVKQSKITFVGNQVEVIAPHQQKDKIRHEPMWLCRTSSMTSRPGCPPWSQRWIR